MMERKDSERHAKARRKRKDAERRKRQRGGSKRRMRAKLGRRGHPCSGNGGDGVMSEQAT